MFRVNSNTNKEKPTKKKLLFISTIISNNNNEHKSFDTTHPKYPSTNITTSTPPSLKNSQNPDKAKRELRNLNKIRNKLKPKIFFKLYRVR